MKKYKLIVGVLLLSFWALGSPGFHGYEDGVIQDSCAPYSSLDAWGAYNAFNKYLFDKTTHLYKANSSIPDGAKEKSKIGAIWTQAIYWDMAMNAYNLAVSERDQVKQVQYGKLVDDIFEGDSTHYVNFDFHNQDTENGWFIYDDIMWWTISFARAYGIFKDPKYLKLADESFCRVWHGSYKLKDRGSYDREKGGMYWQWNRSNPADNSDNGKMACINFPTVVAAMTLYNNIDPSDVKHQRDDLKGFQADPSYPRWHSRDTYLKNAKEIYKWGVNNLFDKSTGNVADSRHGNGVDWSATLYNQGTFIGASCLLYKETGNRDYLDNAILAADYTLNVMSAPLYIFPSYKGDEQGIYTAIFAQYLQMLVDDCGQGQYKDWIYRTIKQGWKHRNNNGLVGKYFTKETRSTVSCYDASGIPALMLLFSDGN